MTTPTAVAWDGVARGYIPVEPLAIDPGLARHETRSPDAAPVTFEVIRYGLLNANVEHGQTLQRLCVSPITMLTRDFQPSILTQDGELVFLGPYLQYFSNAQSLTIKWILENRSDVSISGVSGVSGIATKTSFAMFLLHSITNCGVLAGEAHNTKVLVFSVKGEDLLFLDYANSRLTAAQRALYARLGLPAAPFGNVRVFAPPRRDDPAGTPDVSARDRAVSPFYWTLAEFCADELLPFVFADAEDERAQYTMLIAQVAARLRRDTVPAGDDGAVRVRDVDPANDKIIRTFGDLINLLEAELGDDGTRGSWVAGSTVTGSINALLRRLRSAVRPLSAVIRGDLAHRGERSITTSRAQVTVVDLHNLPDRAQRFVVGVTLRGEFARKERQGTARPLMFVMLDELNKYAPRDGDSPIKQILLDVAERGRSLGVILIGAQQTASEVERRILPNCAIRVAGRLDAAEAERPEYGYLPPAQRQRATLAKPGTMFIAQPDIPVPLAVDFPFPAWATRPSEKGEWAGHDTGPARPADPFATIPGADDDPPPF